MEKCKFFMSMHIAQMFSTTQRTDHRSPLTPPYSPDLTPCDYHISEPLKMTLSGNHFHNENEE
jgi:hypothetical protein